MWIMANRHFGNLADVWKHAVLVEVLEREPPGWYAETHAGSGAYTVVNDGEREFGVLRFLEVAPRFAALARSRYRAIAASYVERDPGLYPGSALLAMTVLGDASSYLLCDLDQESMTDLRRWSRGLGLRRCEVAEADGMTAVAARLDSAAREPMLVHIDPFDPDARAPGGYSALELAARVADSGSRLVYWYGCDEPGAQGRAHKQLATVTRAPLWCGEVMVTGASDSLRDLGRTTTPCTSGIILANVQATTAGACAALGNALSAAYADAVLPDGRPASLAFSTSTTSTGYARDGSRPEQQT
jgi:23S rRNA A2030 N6-methylase RlmJ